jgi:hypothetical protein
MQNALTIRSAASKSVVTGAAALTFVLDTGSTRAKQVKRWAADDKFS